MEKRENSRCVLCGEEDTPEQFCYKCDHLIRHTKKLNTFMPGTVNVPDYEETFECGASKEPLTKKQIYKQNECSCFKKKPKRTLICKRSKDDPKRLRTCSIYGDCLKQIGIPDKGKAVFDLSREIRVGDVVHCSKNAGTLNTYMKQVRRFEGEVIIVGTCYEDSEKDFEFEAAEIMGVCIKVMDEERNVVWEAAEHGEKED